MNDGKPIPIDEQPRYFTVDQTQLRVVRLRGLSQRQAIAESGYSDSRPEALGLFEAMVVMKALACKENAGKVITDYQTGRPVTVRLVERDRLGMVVTQEVFDALAPESVSQIAGLAINTTLSEGQEGNSGAPPAGSITSASG